MSSLGPPPPFEGRGIIIAGGGAYWPSVYVTVRMLRHLGCDLPVEVWYLGSRGERDERYEQWLAPWGVTCVDADTHPGKRARTGRLNGYELKLFAVMNSGFREVLFLDADNYPCQDPTALFSLPAYQQVGGIYWPDLPNTNKWTDWNFWGVVKFGPDCGFETGQFLVDKVTAWKQLALALWYDDHSEWCYGIGTGGDHGDKGPHRAAWAKTRVAPMVFNEAAVWKSVAFLQAGPDGTTPMFVHRCRSKWVLSPHRFQTTSQNGVNVLAGLPLEKEAHGFLVQLGRLNASG